MRKIQFLLVVLLTLGIVSVALADRDDDERGPGPGWGESMHGKGGPGYGHMGGGWGPGMGMGGGMGMMDPQNHPAFSSLSKDKQEALKKIHLDFAKEMLDVQSDMKTHMREMYKAMHNFPLNRKEVDGHYKSMQKLMDTMHDKMLDHVEKVQKALGKEDFEKMSAMPQWRDDRDCPKGEKCEK